MKMLSITESVTRDALLDLAGRIPEAWIGIRIAALLPFTAVNGYRMTLFRMMSPRCHAELVSASILVYRR